MSTDTLVPMVPATAVVDRGVMRGSDVKARLDMIIDIAEHAMKEGIDYGKVPGTDKPSLWQPGADKLCVAFQIAPKIREIQPINDGDEKAYRVIVIGVHQGSSIELGEGAGECSSNEEKYRFRYSVHDNEWNATPSDLRRLKFKRDGSSIKQIRTSPADVANTILKMAVKRAKIAMVLAVTGAAAIFTQDVEDLAEELREQIGSDPSTKAEPRQPQRRSANGTAAAPASKPLPSNAQVVVGKVSKVYDDKKPFGILLKGNQTKYTTFDDAVGKDAKAFEGTDHLVKLAFTTTEKDGRTYHNAVGISIADADPKPAASPAPAKDDDASARDMFGPGAEG